MCLPSGGGARRRGGTHASKAPPLPKTTIFGLTEGQVFGEDQIAKFDRPGSAGRCGPPLRRAVSFLGSTSSVSRKSLSAIGHSQPGKYTRQACRRNGHELRLSVAACVIDHARRIS